MRRSTVEKKAARKNNVKLAVLTGISFAVELFWLVFSLEYLRGISPTVSVIMTLLALIVVMVVFARQTRSNFKLVWILLIAAFPVFGVLLYLVVGVNGFVGTMRKRYLAIETRLFPYFPDNRDVLSEVTSLDPGVGNECRYIQEYSGYPVYNDSEATYYPSAEEALESMLTELAKAEKYIFMEYFAIDHAQAFGRILNVLQERVEAGVDVRILYDEFGSVGFVNREFAVDLQKTGIDCRPFNPIVPIFSLFMNHRDHRKITVIDGRVAFTGGFNLADEYFNLRTLYGHWLDTGIRIKGPAASSFTLIFLENWNSGRKTNLSELHPEDFLPLNPGRERHLLPAVGKRFGTEPGIRKQDPFEFSDWDRKGLLSSRKQRSYERGLRFDTADGSPALGDGKKVPELLKEDDEKGFVQPYADIPLDHEYVGETVYMNVLNDAKNYVYFITPYIAITDEMVNCFVLAAKRGVDVRIITPGIPDKKAVYALTRSYYGQLADAGVRVYEYTPGFCHAKMCISDDKVATCGTINLDYRSFYHHFENGVFLYRCKAVTDIREHFRELFRESEEVTNQYLHENLTRRLRLSHLILRFLSPLM